MPDTLAADLLAPVSRLQRRLRRGARLSPPEWAPGGTTLLLRLEWDPAGVPATGPLFPRQTARTWCGRARVGSGRRGLLLALADALADLAVQSGAGLSLWGRGGVSPSSRAGARESAGSP